MTTQDYLNALRPGEVVGKRVLAALKRAGLIWDYSQYGYLEGVRIVLNGGKKDKWGYIDDIRYEIIRTGRRAEVEAMRKANDWSDTRVTELSMEETIDRIGHPWGHITYKGCDLEYKYFDGCFCPFLVKC